MVARWKVGMPVRLVDPAGLFCMLTRGAHPPRAFGVALACAVEVPHDDPDDDALGVAEVARELFDKPAVLGRLASRFKGLPGDRVRIDWPAACVGIWCDVRDLETIVRARACPLCLPDEERCRHTAREVAQFEARQQALPMAVPVCPVPPRPTRPQGRLF